MSDLRVALVAEGTTDLVVISAALKATLTRPFTLSLLQPEATTSMMGEGWCGVFKWCRSFAARNETSLETDPMLCDFDLIVIHVDADVAGMSYSDGGAPVVAAARGLGVLPCEKPCPPAEDSVHELRQCILSWLGLTQLGS